MDCSHLTRDVHSQYRAALCSPVLCRRCGVVKAAISISFRRAVSEVCVITGRPCENTVTKTMVLRKGGLSFASGPLSGKEHVLF